MTVKSASSKSRVNEEQYGEMEYLLCTSSSLSVTSSQSIFKGVNVDKCGGKMRRERQYFNYALKSLSLEYCTLPTSLCLTGHSVPPKMLSFVE